MTEIRPTTIGSQARHMVEKATSTAKKLVETARMKAEVISFDQKFNITSNLGLSPAQQKRFDNHFSNEVQRYRKEPGSAERHSFGSSTRVIPLSAEAPQQLKDERESLEQQEMPEGEINQRMIGKVREMEEAYAPQAPSFLAQLAERANDPAIKEEMIGIHKAESAARELARAYERMRSNGLPQQEIDAHMSKMIWEMKETLADHGDWYKTHSFASPTEGAEFLMGYQESFGFNNQQMELLQLSYARKNTTTPHVVEHLDREIARKQEEIRQHNATVAYSPIDESYGSVDVIMDIADKLGEVRPADTSVNGDVTRFAHDVVRVITEVAHPKPKLENIQSVRATLTNDEDLQGGEIPTWQRLNVPEKPDGQVYSLMELNGQIRDTVREYVAGRLDKLREIPSFEAFQEVTDADLLNVLTHGWMDAGTVPDAVTDQDTERGTQSKLLLATAEHMVSRIEIGVYKRFLASASPEQLAAMGLSADLRDVMTKVLTVSSRANPLFVRFMGYVMPESTDSPYTEGDTDISPNYSGTALFMPEGQGPYDLATLFPKESRALAQGFEGILRDSARWQGVRGAEAFRRHLQALADLHKSNTDGILPSIEDRQRAVQDSYNELLQSGFPIIITPQLDPGEKSPYIDPELKVSLVVPEDAEQMQEARVIQDEMAELFPTLGEDVGAFADDLRNMTIKHVVTMGAFGSNLVLRSVAQEKESIIMYLDEQERAFGQELAGKIRTYIDTGEEINFDRPETQAIISRMSRIETFLHEGDHAVYRIEGEVSQRMGSAAAKTMDEVKADTLYRAMIPDFIDLEVRKGTVTPERAPLEKAQWAVVTLGTMLQNIELGEGTEYYQSNIHLLNVLLEPHGETPPALMLHEGKLRITNTDAFYATIKAQAQEVLDLYRTPEMDPETAEAWVETHCKASEQSETVLEALGIR